MRLLRYDQILAQVGRNEAADFNLSAASWIICMSALQALECRYVWRGQGGNLSDSEWDTAQNWVDVALHELCNPVVCEGTGVEIGQLVFQVFDTVPSHLLYCNGAQYEVADYPDLAALLLGQLWPQPFEGESEDFFKVPDFGYRALVGAIAQTNYYAGQQGGEFEHTLTVAEMPEHGHEVPRRLSYGSSSSYVGGASTTGTINNQDTTLTGGGEAHNNISPYTAWPIYIVALIP